MNDRPPFRFRDDKGLRASINRLQPATLFVECSVDPETGVGGFGAVLVTRNEAYEMSGVLEYPGAGQTLSEAWAIWRSLRFLVSCNRLLGFTALTFGLRNTATLSILRWVFAEAPFIGDVEVPIPQKLSAATREAQCLYDLHDLVEELRLSITLQHVVGDDSSELALGLARGQMGRARAAR